MNDRFSDVVLPQPASVGLGYNFGERPSSNGSVIGSQQTATIGFWHNKNGQQLIRSLNGGADSKQLGNWLAATLPNMYSGAREREQRPEREDERRDSRVLHHAFLPHQKNRSRGRTAQGEEAQVFAVALATYVTNQTLAGNVAAAYGFRVTDNGVGAKTVNVGTSGAAFGLADGSDAKVLDLLLAVNERTRGGEILYDMNGDGDTDDTLETVFRTITNDVFTAINELGDR